jgi:hypothetical protein
MTALQGPLTDMPPLLAMACNGWFRQGRGGAQVGASRRGGQTKEMIGTGYHERAVIDLARFLARLKKKVARMKGGRHCGSSLRKREGSGGLS